MKSQMREANKLKAKFAIIIGDNELENNEVIIRNMITRDQNKVSFNDIPNFTFIDNQ